MGLVLALSAATAPSPAAAFPAFVESDHVTFGLGGYVRSLAGVQFLQVDKELPVPLDEEIGLTATVTRFEWRLSLFDVATLDVHNRFYFYLTSATDTLGSSGALGLGVSTPPKRAVDLRSDIVDKGTWRFEHDLDRLTLRFFAGPVDISLGRQAVTWGYGNLFSVADLWTTFSPFELDTSQKRGVDGLRVVYSPTSSVELDLVAADRGHVEDLSAGLRASFYLDGVDAYVALAKHWNELIVFTGASAEADAFKVRAEAALPFDLDAADVLQPRVTLGFDYFHPKVMVSVEAHYNGAGVSDPDDYLTHSTTSEPLQRGEVYLMGQLYAGALVMYKPHDLVALTCTVMGNLLDPSALVTLNASYDVAQDITISLGAFTSIGARPEISLTPALRSEFGSYGHLVYLDVSAFF